MIFNYRFKLFFNWPILLGGQLLKLNPNLLTGKHFLFTPAYLRIDQFGFKRKKVQHLFKNKEDSFKNLLKYNENEVKNNYIYEHDLKNMIYLCKNDAHELALLRKMAKRYSRQHPSESQNFSFGPELMRLYYVHNTPLEAKGVICDEELKGFFSGTASYLIYMTMLYNAGLYQDVVDTFRRLLDVHFRRMFPRPFTTLTLASLYQMNSPESLKAALDLVKDIEKACRSTNSNLLDPKYFTFVAALALDQNDPHLAFELISKVSVMDFVMKNIKLKVLIQLGRLEDVVSVMRITAETSSQKLTKEETKDLFILENTFDEVEAALENAGKKEAAVELRSLKWNLAKKSLIMKKSLKEIICAPIDNFEDIQTKKKADRRRQFSELLKRGKNR